MKSKVIILLLTSVVFVGNVFVMKRPTTENTNNLSKSEVVTKTYSIDKQCNTIEYTDETKSTITKNDLSEPLELNVDILQTKANIEKENKRREEQKAVRNAQKQSTVSPETANVQQQTPTSQQSGGFYSEEFGRWFKDDNECIEYISEPKDKLLEHYKTMGFQRTSIKMERFVYRHVKPAYDKDCIFMYQVI